MTRPIDADALNKEFREFVRVANNSDFEPVPTWNDAVSLVGSAPTVEHPNRFHVINKRTGKRPNLWLIARRCEWAKHLCYCDMEGFAITEDGTLILMDECGKVAYPPKGRYKVVWEDEDEYTDNE